MQEAVLDEATTGGLPLTAQRVVGHMTEELAAAGIESARGDAWLLLAAATGRSRADLIAHADRPLMPDEADRLSGMLLRRRAREPMAYILGEREFWSLPFRVGPGVLVPRPETETVVEAALATIPDRGAPLRVLDLGTGSGCLLLALLSELPNATGLGVDASGQALAIATANAERLGLSGRARFQAGDWGRGLAGPFDLIVSNPPYVAEADWPTLEPEIHVFEPAGALLGGRDGLSAYRALAPDVARLLVPGGIACVELGQGQTETVAEIMRDRGLAVAGTRRDLAGMERALILQTCLDLMQSLDVPKSCAGLVSPHIALEPGHGLELTVGNDFIAA